ncbi:MAG: hypothetical protein ACXW31_04300 [Thermoanaerobaculia bacterium]
MPNLFPDLEPDFWEIQHDAYQERDTAKSGGVQINAYDPVVQMFPRGRWEILQPRTEIDQIEDHFYAYRDDVFSLYDFELRKMRNLFVAVADGVATVYTLPAKAVAGAVIRHNAVAAGTQPTLLVGTGAEGEAQIQYTAPTKPGSGVVITLDASDARQKLELIYATPKWVPRRVAGTGNIYEVQLDFVQDVING